MDIYILGIESSCDDTSASVLRNTVVLSNVIANQEVHQKYGGVVPELASRAHQQNIVPVVEAALQEANINKNQLQVIAYTRGPGLLGSLLVGSSFAKAFALSKCIDLVEVDHMEAHILAHFITENEQSKTPDFPFLCLTVSGGHSQIVKVNDYFNMEVLGKTIDDAAGEAFDKAAKILGLPYPGGPLIDHYAKQGNPMAFKLAEPAIPNLDYSFSGLKTSFLYLIRDHLKANPDFIRQHLPDLAASIQRSIINALMKKLIKASKQTGIRQVAIAGGVSANSGLRQAMAEAAENNGWEVFIPKTGFTTDNAAMIGVAGFFKFQSRQLAHQKMKPYTRQANRN